MIEGFRYETAWLPWIGGLLIGLLLLVVVAYVITPAVGWRRFGLAGLKALALLLLVACLLNPSQQLRQPKPGENLLLFAVDESLSMASADGDSGQTFREQVRKQFSEDAAWLDSLEEQFQVRYYALGDQLHSLRREQVGSETAPQSRLFSQLDQLVERYRGRPVAGVVVVTDGLATDVIPQTLPTDEIPIYPVVLQTDERPIDLAVVDIQAQPTQFESAPLRISVSLRHLGLEGRTAKVGIFDEQDEPLVVRSISLSESGRATLNLEVEQFTGTLARYRVLTRLDDEWTDAAMISEADSTIESTLLNNQQRILVPRRGGPFRMLYVSGRPNWEFKFLRRASQDDPEIQLVGLLRLALKEPRFAFLDSEDRRNPLFQGSASEEEGVEQYNQPVLVRMGTVDENELRDGFPKSAAELFNYSALVLDDIDSEFFTQDQLDLIQEFVDRRGGGLLMLGGPEGFDGGQFERTVLSDLLPIYTQTARQGLSRPVRWELTREGWLTPWTRLRDTESAENQVRSTMPEFRSVNRVEQLKPGAALLSVLTDETGQTLPALATQSYGRGRSAALMIGDVFRWRLRSPAPTRPNPSRPAVPNQANSTSQSDTSTMVSDDFGQSWRQLLRWLVSDLPRRVEIEVEEPTSGSPQRSLLIAVRDKEFQPDDSANVQIVIRFPDGSEVKQTAEATLTQGQYRTSVTLDEEGFYEVTCVASDRDGETIDSAQTGWAWEPIGDELRQLIPATAVWKQWAEDSEGKSLTMSQLPRIHRMLNYDKVAETQIEQKPLWHHWPIFLTAIILLGIEWGWRRWLGLA